MKINLENENNDNIVQSKTHVYRDRTQYKHRENMCKAKSMELWYGWSVF